MLFNSYEFLFLFLPIVLAVFFALGRRSHRLAMGWLAAASLFFYGWWYAPYLVLLLISVLWNFTSGIVIARSAQPRRHRLLLLAVAGDLALLGYFKYAGFLVASADGIFGRSWPVPSVALPLGISFFTLTQIAFLVDTARGEARDYKFVHYLLFVSYFPHLIAGPILHHKELMPQLDRADIVRFSARRLALGLSYFAIGLFKKTVIADALSRYVGHVFDGAAHGMVPSGAEAWGAVLAYTLQLYFDFSGYSDMAIGLARMIGVQLPLNFHSPYKATSIIEFWRRWHMTLSRFLRDYLYIPLGGNRRGPTRRYVNVMVTMLIGGLWHGAGWNFVLWGGLHGVYLVINHGWRALAGARGRAPSVVGTLACGLLTFVCVAVAWVPFRANGWPATVTILTSLAGWHGWLPGSGLPGVVGVLGEGAPRWLDAWKWVAVLLPAVWLLPNTQEFFSRYGTLPPPRRADRLPLPMLALRWRLSPRWAYATAVIAVVAVVYCGRASEFIYFQF
ncbi:MAG TPA: MBOAT family protein [Stellaceae bacterium]